MLHLSSKHSQRVSSFLLDCSSFHTYNKHCFNHLQEHCENGKILAIKSHWSLVVKTLFYLLKILILLRPLTPFLLWGQVFSGLCMPRLQSCLIDQLRLNHQAQSCLFVFMRFSRHWFSFLALIFLDGKLLSHQCRSAFHWCILHGLANFER